jgi:hypothetical protein
MSTTEDVTFVITGVNDDPFFTTPPVTITGSPFLGSTFGVHRADNIGFSDPDNADIFFIDDNDTHVAFARFNAEASGGSEIGHLSAFVEPQTIGSDLHGIVHWDYDVDAAAFGFSTTPVHQVYDIVLQDNHGGQTTQPFVVDLFPYV